MVRYFKIIFTIYFSIAAAVHCFSMFMFVFSNEFELKERLLNFFVQYNAWFEVILPVLTIPASVAMGAWLAHRVIGVMTTQKKSYEDEMAIYDENQDEAKEVIISEKLSLEELLTDDGEIPDHLLRN